MSEEVRRSVIKDKMFTKVNNSSLWKSKPEIMRHVIFLVGVITSSSMLYTPLNNFFHSLMFHDYHYLIAFIPLISGYLIYSKREYVYSEKKYSFVIGTSVIFIGIVLYVTGNTYDLDLNLNDHASVIIFSATLVIWGAFIFSFGILAFRKSLFPLLFLTFMIPIPTIIMDKIIYFLQVSSAEVSNLLFLASGAPFFREGFVFHLPGQSIEVATQCSGIRSCLALLIISVLAGHLFLKTWWKKVILVICSIPIAMFKNGIRIVTLTLLGSYVDPRILGSSLHREGGIPFFILALSFMAPLLYFFRKSEKTLDTLSSKE